MLIKDNGNETKSDASDTKEKSKSVASDEEGKSKSAMQKCNLGPLVIPIEGCNVPLIVVKSDGGYNYATTDLAALWYRLNEEKAEWVIYVTGN